MIDWRAKLTSRKFWAAIADFVAMLIIAFGGSQETATQVTALIMAGAAVVAYIISEGLIDAAAAKQPEGFLPEIEGDGGMVPEEYDPEEDDGR